MSWLLADRNFPLLLGALCGAASLFGVGLGALIAVGLEKLRSLRTPQVPIAWEGVE